MKKIETLIIDGRTVKDLVNIGEVIEEVERSFGYFGEGRVRMPAKVYIHLDEYKGDFRAMPAYVHSLKSCGVKWVNVHPENRKKGLPTVMAVMILSDPATGFPLCVMDATYATALRTGAAGAVAAKYLARKNSRVAAFVGCGVQAKMQFEALNDLFRIDSVRLWGLRKEEMVKFKRYIKGRARGIEVELFSEISSCVEASDIVVTTTPSRRPLIKRRWLKEGAHINAIGADAKGKRELELGILKEGKIVVDAWEQASHSGEINVPLRRGQLSERDVYADIGEIVTGRKKGRKNRKEITVFDSTGLAIQDIAIADLIYRKAKRLKKARRMSLVMPAEK